MSKRKILTLAACSLFAGASGLASQEREFPVLRGPYLGQSPPGTRPEVFSPEIFSVNEDFVHSVPVFSPDGNEVYWCARKNRFSTDQDRRMQVMYRMRMLAGTWSRPETAPFSLQINGEIQRPVFSSDGGILYFEVFDPVADDVDIYAVQRIEGGWSDPAPVSQSINSEAIERLYHIGTDGSMFFSRNLTTRNEKVFRSRRVNGDFGEPERLGSAFNSEAAEYAMVMPGDEAYLLTCHNPSRYGASEVFVSFKERDETWSERIGAGFHCGGFLALSPNGEYLFFLDENILWISTAFLDDLKPDRLR